MLLAPGTVHSEEKTQWPLFHGDTGLTGYSQTTLPSDMSLLWRTGVGGEVSSCPAAAEGLICCAAGGANVVALNMKGKKIWTMSAKGGAALTPATIVDGMVIYGSENGTVTALKCGDGTKLWEYQTGGAVIGAPNFRKAKDGSSTLIIVLERTEGNIHAIDALSGRRKWFVRGAARSDAAPAVGDGRIVYGSCAAQVHVVSMDLRRKIGDISLGEGCEAAAPAAVRGTAAYCGDRSGALNRFELPALKRKWRNTDGEGEMFTVPAVSGDRVVFSSGTGRIICLKASDGTLLWSYGSGPCKPVAPVIAGDKVAAVRKGVLCLLSLETGKMLWKYHVGDQATSPGICGGLLFLGTGAGEVMAFGARTGLHGP